MLSKLKAIFNTYRHSLLALLFFSTLIVIDSWPLLTNLNHTLIGNDNDVFINPWADWWTAKALHDPQQTLWYTNYLFYPKGASLIYHSFSHLNTAVSLLLQTFIAPIAAYNLAILANYLLIGIATFHLTRYLTNSTIASLLAGVIFTFNTHSIYQSAHPVLVSTWCIPWFTLYLMRAIRENKIHYALIAALFYFLAASASILLLIIISLWAIALVSYLFFSNRHTFPYRLFLIFGFTSLILILPIIYPLLRETISQVQGSFITSPTDSISSNIATFITPPWYLWEKRGVYLGLPLMLLLLIVRPKKAGWWWTAFIITSLIAIGPYPRWASERPNILLPWSLPIVFVLRHSNRLNILISFTFSIIVAYGWTDLAERLKQRALQPAISSIIGLLLILFVYIDYTAYSFPQTPIEISTFYTDFLKDIPDNVALAIIPFGRQEDKRYLLYQTFHQHPITGGVISRPLPDTTDFIAQNSILQATSTEEGFVTSIPANLEQELTNLALKNIGYLVIHKDLLSPRQVRAWRTALPLTPVFEDTYLLAYDINALEK